MQNSSYAEPLDFVALWAQDTTEVYLGITKSL